MNIKEDREKHGKPVGQFVPVIIDNVALASHEKDFVFIMDLQNQDGDTIRVGMSTEIMNGLKEGIDRIVQQYPDLMKPAR